MNDNYNSRDNRNDYSSQSNERDGNRGYERRDNNRSNNNFRDDESKTQLFIAKGRNDQMDAGSLIEFISAQTGIEGSSISSVKVLDAFSFFAVSHEDADMILDFFLEKAGEGRPLVSKAKRKDPNESRGGERRNDGRRSFGDRNNNDRGERRSGGFGGGSSDRRSSGGGFGGNSGRRDSRDDNRGNSFGGGYRNDRKDY
ncbi:MAG: DbpA RNA binding domain-containing protein [Pseudomonadota bacterium]